MKTRIIHTKIHDDTWFNTLSIPYRYLFIYLFTNQRIGLTGIYFLPERVVLFETGLTNEELLKGKELLSKSKKAIFYMDWVYIPKSSLYGGYSGVKNEVAFNNELKSIPYKVKTYFFNRVSLESPYPIDTPINHKSKIINHKSKIINTDRVSEKGLSKLRAQAKKIKGMN